MAWILKAMQWISDVPKLITPWQPGVLNKYQAVREAWHFVWGAVFSGLAWLLGSWVPIEWAYGVVGAVLAFVIIFKEVRSTNQPPLKTALDILFWGLGFYSILILNIWLS